MKIKCYHHKQQISKLLFVDGDSTTKHFDWIKLEPVKCLHLGY